MVQGTFAPHPMISTELKYVYWRPSTREVSLRVIPFILPLRCEKIFASVILARFHSHSGDWTIKNWSKPDNQNIMYWVHWLSINWSSHGIKERICWTRELSNLPWMFDKPLRTVMESCFLCKHSFNKLQPWPRLNTPNKLMNTLDGIASTQEVQPLSPMMWGKGSKLMQ